MLRRATALKVVKFSFHLIAFFTAQDVKKPRPNAMQQAKRGMLKARLQNMGSGSELELDLAGTTLAKANAEFSVSNAMVKMCSIKAPFRGRVASRKANADRKSTRLNSSHITISYAVFCLKKKKQQTEKKT